MMGLRKYARHRELHGLPGGTLSSVQEAIRSGRLSASLTPDGRRIRSAAKADAEWLATTKADCVPLTGPTAPKNGRAPREADESAPAPVNELGAARARREAARSELAEIELAEKRGELVRARDMEDHMADVFLRCRTKLLGIVPRLRQQDPTLTPAQLELVEALLVESLEELAGGAAA